jgi:hypothetical protein
MYAQVGEFCVSRIPLTVFLTVPLTGKTNAFFSRNQNVGKWLSRCIGKITLFHQAIFFFQTCFFLVAKLGIGVPSNLIIVVPFRNRYIVPKENAMP